MEPHIFGALGKTLGVRQKQEVCSLWQKGKDTSPRMGAQCTYTDVYFSPVGALIPERWKETPTAL